MHFQNSESCNMASYLTTSKVLKLVLSEEEDEDNDDEIYFDGSNEDFGLVEEEIDYSEMDEETMIESNEETMEETNDSTAEKIMVIMEMKMMI